MRTSDHPPSKRRDEPDEAYVELATVVKPHGLDGNVWVDLHTDFPERLPEWPALEIVGPRGPHRARVESVKGLVGERCIVKLEGVEDREQAEAIRGYALRIRRSALPPPPEGAYYEFQIIGLRVVTTEGRDLGRVQEILRTGANDVYETERALIPAVGDIVETIDLDRGRIVVRDIEGLLK